MRIIEVLGSGCPNCQAVERNVHQALTELGLEDKAEVHHVTDWAEIAGRGVLSTPGLAIDGTVVSTGRIPTPSQVADWLRSPVAGVADVTGQIASR
jgi:small redox-active disulfide protein 2